MLSDLDFQKALANGDLKIEPKPKPTDLQSASYDLKVGRVKGRIEKMHVKDGSPPGFELKDGETAVVLTLERIYLSEKLGGNVSLTNRLASQGIHLLNPGHVDPGWGGQAPEKGENQGLALTAFLKNISGGTLTLVQGQPFLTLTLSRLDTPTERPYWSIHDPPPDELTREAELEAQALEIAKFSEPQRELENELHDMRADLKSKVAWSELMTPLSVLIAGLGIVVSVTIGIVTGASAYSKILIGPYELSVPFFLAMALPFMLLAAVSIVYAISWLGSAIRHRKSRTPGSRR